MAAQLIIYPPADGYLRSVLLTQFVRVTPDVYENALVAWAARYSVCDP